MPNVNLIEEEDGGGEGSMQPMAAPVRRRRGGGGGGGSKFILFVVVIIILGGGVFALNKFGIIKLWGKKPQPVVIAQIPEEQFTPEQYAQTDTSAVMDTSSVSFVETPPLVEQKQPETGGLVMDKGGKSTRISETMTSTTPTTPMAESKLGEMQGNYTIQVSAWRDKVTAEQYVKRLEDAGYPAFVEQRSVKDGSWFTVRIGRYSSIKEAKKAADSFAYEIKANYWIDRIRSN